MVGWFLADEGGEEYFRSVIQKSMDRLDKPTHGMDPRLHFMQLWSEHIGAGAKIETLFAPVMYASRQTIDQPEAWRPFLSNWVSNETTKPDDHEKYLRGGLMFRVACRARDPKLLEEFLQAFPYACAVKWIFETSERLGWVEKSDTASGAKIVSWGQGIEVVQRYLESKSDFFLSCLLSEVTKSIDWREEPLFRQNQVQDLQRASYAVYDGKITAKDVATKLKDLYTGLHLSPEMPITAHINSPPIQVTPTATKTVQLPLF